jgi:hypothetical protein
MPLAFLSEHVHGGLEIETTSKPADKLSEARSTVEERRFSAA